MVKYCADHAPMANKGNLRDVSLWHAYHISRDLELWKHSSLTLYKIYIIMEYFVLL